MTDEPTREELDAVEALLSDPALWAEPSPDVEDRVLAAIAAEVAAGAASGAAPSDPAANEPASESLLPGRRAAPGGGERLAGGTPSPPAERRVEPVDLSARRKRRRWVGPVLAAATLVVVALAALALVDRGPTAEIETVALAGTEAAPGASAIAEIEHRANGDRILLAVESLDPAPEGSFYAVWVIEDDPALRVGAGTFHMRGGDATIELWSGVSTETYRTVSVTLQSVDDPNGPGEVVLRGRIDQP